MDTYRMPPQPQHVPPLHHTPELCHQIDPSTHRHKIYGTKVEIKLPKVNESMWGTLERVAGSGPVCVGAAVPAAASSGAGGEAGVRPYSSTKDWDKINQGFAEEEANEKPEGDEALNKLFRDIYAKATPETRRAMNKSFVRVHLCHAAVQSDLSLRVRMRYAIPDPFMYWPYMPCRRKTNAWRTYALVRPPTVIFRYSIYTLHC